MPWKRLLAYITGSVDEELLRRNEYLVAENRILRSHISGRLRLTDPERVTLAKLGKKLGRVLLFPPQTAAAASGPVKRRERIGGLLSYYHREAA